MGNSPFGPFEIRAKGAVSRLTLQGDPRLGSAWPKSLEQGRLGESDIAEAILYKQTKQQWLAHKIKTYFGLIKLGNDGQLPDFPRKFKYIADVIDFTKTVKDYMSYSLDLVNSLGSDVQTLVGVIAEVNSLIYQSLAGISMLLHEICNWGLPDLPSLPNIFSDLIWRFNGWQFFPLSFAYTLLEDDLNFLKNFSFSQCNIHLPSIDIFSNYPNSIPSPLGGYSFGTPIFAPPLGGIISTGPDNLTYLGGQTATPVYSPTFNSTNMNGSLPDPYYIIGAYSLTPEDYIDNIISTVSSLQDVVVTPDKSNYLSYDPNNPPLNLLNELRQLLIRFVNLDEIVKSNYDPLLVGLWLYYLDICRTARGGVWIDEFQNEYASYIQPSVDFIEENRLPWNNFNGTLSKGNPSIPLISAMKADINLLWRLSFIEEALLGYTRTLSYDDASDNEYLNSYTGSDIDFKALSYTSDTELYTLGLDNAEYPVDITFPRALHDNFLTVVGIATSNINNNPSWSTSRPQFRYTYDQYANAVEVDRFTQFWREFASNLNTLLNQDPYLVGFVINYVEVLNSAINPLADQTYYNKVRTDAISRNRSWVPGFPLPSIPKAPFLGTTETAGASLATSGWGSNDDFDASIFMARPDIQAQSIPVQLAMLRTNQSYAALRKFQDSFNTQANSLIASAQDTIKTFQSVSLHVLNSSLQTIPTGNTGTPVNFDSIDSNNGFTKVSASLYQIITPGTYLITGVIHWASGSQAVRTYQIVLNSSTILDSESTDGGVGPVDQPFNAMQDFNVNDTFQINVFTSAASSMDIEAGSELYCILPPEAPAAPLIPDTAEGSNASSENTVQTFIAATNLALGVVVDIDSSGKAIATDPTTTTAPYVNGVTTAAANSGSPLTVAVSYGGIYQIEGSNFTVGGVLYCGLNGSLTQDYATLITEAKWVCVIGKAVTSDTILFQPHAPTNIIQNFS